MVAPYVPHAVAKHAGGAYLHRHLRAVPFADVTLVAPRTKENLQASVACERPVILFELKCKRLFVLLDRVSRFFFPWSPGYFTSAAILAAIRDQKLSRGDVVEVHWPEYQGIVPRIKRLCDARLISIPHDVLSQRLSRARSAGSSAPRQLQAYVALRACERAESRIFGIADEVVVFSLKDADLVKAAAGNSSPRVIDPPIAGSDTGARDVRLPVVQRDRRFLLFTGAFDRSVNEEAALVLISTVFPPIRDKFQDVDLVLAGNAPTSRMLGAASADPRVRLTGWVRELSPYYAQASIFLAPLRRGAGVKFKCVEALMHGLVSIVSPVAAEGLDSSLFYVVSHDLASVVEACTALLNEDERSVERRRSALAIEAGKRFGVEKHLTQIRELYDSVYYLEG